mmetsp:Transcript_21861/g.37250  ORF Transcript_21861/g.37250 Transcript_21861/m.37250 type:complete len:237 (-) Transcript_21861:41-751(-)
MTVSFTSADRSPFISFLSILTRTLTSFSTLTFTRIVLSRAAAAPPLAATVCFTVGLLRFATAGFFCALTFFFLLLLLLVLNRAKRYPLFSFSSRRTLTRTSFCSTAAKDSSSLSSVLEGSLISVVFFFAVLGVFFTLALAATFGAASFLGCCCSFFLFFFGAGFVVFSAFFLGDVIAGVSTFFFFLAVLLFFSCWAGLSVVVSAPNLADARRCRFGRSLALRLDTRVDTMVQRGVD